MKIIPFLGAATLALAMAMTASARTTAKPAAAATQVPPIAYKERILANGLRVLSLRIGNVGERPLDKRRLAIWIRPDDLVQLIRIGLEHPDLRYEVMYGASYNERSWWDNSVAYRYGYRPKGRAEDFLDHALAEQSKLPPDPVGDFYQGGTFCSVEFDGDKDQIWS